MLKAKQLDSGFQGRFDEERLEGVILNSRSGNVTPRVDRGFGKMYLGGNSTLSVGPYSKEDSDLFEGREKFLKPTIPKLVSAQFDHAPP